MVVFDNDDIMNFLFYVGIIIPTLITVTLFLIFIYCWFLQKARKEVLTKKYDPHGKMRRLGMSMDPPLPPTYCRIEDALLPDNGEDNVAYDVSRSPSTEQDGRGRPMYHTYHDSGISAGLSPSQECEPRSGLAYRSCPDSGISGFGPQLPQCSYHVSRVCCQVEESFQRPLGEHVQVNAHQQLPCHQHQAALHQNLVQASVHPTHGVCYGDNTNHPQSPQHYNPPLVHPTSLDLAHYNERQFNRIAHVHKSPTQPLLLNQKPFCPENYQIHKHNDQQCYQGNEIIDHHHKKHQSPTDHQHKKNQSPTGQQSHIIAVTPTASDSQFTNRAISLPSVNVRPLPDPGSTTHTRQLQSSPSSPSKPLRHPHRDGNIVNKSQPTLNGADRPDSQASQSSTTDSEDSGFRSSHCAAHHTARLSKQGNPLLKPLRRTKNNKTKNKPHKTVASNADVSQTNGATPLITLSPQNLQTNVDNSNVIQNTPMMDLEMAHRPPSRFIQHNSNLRNINSNDRVPMSSSSAPQVSVTTAIFHDSSPIRTHHSPVRENWQSQSVNDDEIKINQNIDLNEISTHLSWKYLQDLSSSNNAYTGASNGGMVIQACHQGIRSGQMLQSNQEQHMEMFGFSVV